MIMFYCGIMQINTLIRFVKNSIVICQICVCSRYYNRLVAYSTELLADNDLQVAFCHQNQRRKHLSVYMKVVVDCIPLSII